MGSALELWKRALAEASCREAIAVAAGIALLVLLALDCPPPLAMLLLGGLVALATVRRAAAVLLVAAVVPFAPVQVTVGDARFSVLEVAVCGAIAGVALGELVMIAVGRRWRTLSEQVRALAVRARFVPLALLLLVVGTASLGVVADPAHLRESVREWRWVIVEPIAWYVAALWVLRNGTYRGRLLSLWIAGTLVAALWCLGQWFLGGGLAVEGVRRLAGFYPHPNAAALALERAAPAAAALALRSRRGRALWGVGAATIALATVLTFSRGAIMALTVSLVIATLLAGYRRLGVGLAVGSSLLLVLAILTFPQRFRADFAGGSEGLRLAIWRSTVRMLADRPLTGVGLDQYLYQYAPRYVEPVAWLERFTSHPHNLVLDAWVRLGVGGLIALGCAVWLVRRTARLHDPLDLAVCMGLLAGSVHGIVDRGYFAPDLALSFWLAAAILDVPRPAPSAASATRR
ncbi:MAG: O-antigen ligase family protein [Thermomicrobium sp.]|nr:O-antigen ligase family protein [Thermomicrobium sp.]